MSEEARRLGPGSYNMNKGSFNFQAVREKSFGPGWKEAYKSEMDAKMPHLLNKEQFERRRKLKENLGPGSYKHKDMWDDMNSRPQSKYGACSTLVPRFSRIPRDPPNSHIVPGPGTYGLGGIPQKVLEEKDRSKSSTVIMRSGGGKPRISPQVGCDLGPGEYEYKSFINELIDKVTSKKGPYDLFSGSRTKPMTHGFYAQPVRTNLGPGQYPISSFTDKWKDEFWKSKGKFGKIAQYPKQPTDYMFVSNLSQCLKNPDEPGPGSYDPKLPTKPVKHNKTSFNTSAKRSDKRAMAYFMGSAGTNPCGVGRYNVDRSDLATRKSPTSHSSAFKSKTKRYGSSHTRGRDAMLQERLREKDMPLTSKVTIVDPIKV